MSTESSFSAAADQWTGSFVDGINQARLEALQTEINRILADENQILGLQKEALKQALAQVAKAKDFLSRPEHILGSDLTKHGEIAEQIEVNIRNAYDLLHGKIPTATFEGIGRTAPEDYLIDGLKVQSKFINGVSNNLDHILQHMEKYESFGKSGSYYHIPKDTYETITKILNGENPDGLSERSINTILQKVRQIEKDTGRSFQDAVKPSISTYHEVQRGAAEKTLRQHEDNLHKQDNQIQDEIKGKSSRAREQAQQAAKPNLAEGVKAGLIGGAVSGGLSLVLSVYKKHKQGLSIFDYQSSDWKEVGIDFGKGALKGGVTGMAIYGLTNFTAMTAPMASAFVSASFGVTNLIMDYKNNKIDFSEFMEQGQILCLETGIVALGSVIGQTLIPIPIVGTLVGSFAASALVNLTKGLLGKESQRLEEAMNQALHTAMSKINHEYRKIIDAVIQEYERLGSITKMAFDFECNAAYRFESSKRLALAYQVEEKKILKNLNEIDAYFLD